MSKLAVEYATTIKDFLDENVSIKDFQRSYLIKFKTEDRIMTDVEYETLNWIFTDLDCFDPDGTATYGTSLNENELRTSIAERYWALKLSISN